MTAEPETPGAKAEWGKIPKTAHEIRFLEGPDRRRYELGRAVRIFFEFLYGFRSLHFLGPCVTVFGSARFPESHRYYDLAREMGRRIARISGGLIAHPFVP